MKKRILFIPVLIFIAAFCFAQESGSEVPSSIANNQYFLQSVRLNDQAKAAFEEGDYDASTAYAEQSAEFARLSNEYVAKRLSDDAFARAHSRYTWAGSVGAASRYPSEYRTATTAYNEAVQARKDEKWNDSTDASNRVIAALANVKAAGSTPVAQTRANTLPAQFTVRDWHQTGDCFSEIAGRKGVYNDPRQWRKLYDANRNKLPEPNNPHLILPGMVIDIPALPGEIRQGMWDPSVNY